MPSAIETGTGRAEPATARNQHRRRFTVDALFADGRPQAVGVTDLTAAKEIRLDRIVADPDQPRRTFDPDKLAELAESICREGVLQPIAVRYDAAADVYVVVHGERRWRASQAVGLPTIPAIVREVPAERRLLQQLMENIVRDDLNAVDRAAALRALKAQLGDAPWERVAEHVGIRRSRLFQLLGTEKLPAAAQDDIRAGRLSEKQSRALHGLLPEHQESLRAAIVDDDLPAADAIRLARSLRESAAPNGDDRPDATRGNGRSREDAVASRNDPTAILLAAVAAAAGGGRAEKRELARLADASGCPPFMAARLEADLRGLADSLARAPAPTLAPGAPAYLLLVGLRSALDAILDAAPSQ